MARKATLYEDIGRLRMDHASVLLRIDEADAGLAEDREPDADFAALDITSRQALVNTAGDTLAGWQAAAIAAMRGLDAEGRRLGLQFERMIDPMSGVEGRFMPVIRRYWRHRVDAGRTADQVRRLIIACVSFEQLCQQSHTAMTDRHRFDEAGVMAIVDLRRRTEADPSLVGPRAASISLAHGFGSDRQKADAIRRACIDLVSVYNGYLHHLNRHIALSGAMASKLAIDIEQRISLLKAIEARGSLPAVLLPEAVADAISAIEAKPLFGRALAERKERANDVFERLANLSPRTQEAAASHEADDDAGEPATAAETASSAAFDR